MSAVAGRPFLQPRPAVYDTARDALRTVCLALERPVRLDEFVELAGEDVAVQIRLTYPNHPLRVKANYLLGRLVNLGQACATRSSNRCWYSPVGLKLPKSIPAADSRLQRTLLLLRATVKHVGRAARVVDLRTHALDDPTNADLLEWLAHDIAILKRWGKVRVVAECRGGGYDGSMYYLPADHEATSAPVEPARTWMGEVEDAFRGAWAAEVERAREAGTRPKPLALPTVRRLLLESDPHSKARQAQLLINAAASLSEGESAVIRVVGTVRARYQRLWAPIGIPDAALDLGAAFASDSERLVESVRRACAAECAPAVPASSIQKAISRDPELHLQGKQSLHATLSCIARRSSDPRRTRMRIRQNLAAVGRVRGHAYYVAPPGESDFAQAGEAIAAGLAYVATLNAERELQDLKPETEILNAARTRLTCVRTGRARYLALRLKDLARSLSGFVNSDCLPPSGLRLIRKIREIQQRLDHAGQLQPTGAAGLPESVQLPSVGWTAAEVVPMFAHLYAAHPRLSQPAELRRHLWKHCARIPNPCFTVRNKSAEFLFEGTSVRLHLAGLSGGREAVLLAGLAEEELGPLRDPAFVLPGLQSSDELLRHTAVAALAFLPSAHVEGHFRSIALTDPAPSVRRSALWAYGVAGGGDVLDVCTLLASSDVDRRVRTFTKVVLSNPQPTNWWIL